jgi:DNA (cytosine-5)-methyltransferase 1
VGSIGRRLRGISLFSNCGAGDVGFRQAGFTFDVLAEIDARRLSVAKLNHPEAVAIQGDLRQTWRAVVRQYKGLAGNERLALLSACPPCQGMSSVRGDRGSEADLDAAARDERNLLVVPIANVAKALQPRIIVVENVPAFLRRLVRDPKTGKGVPAAQLLIAALARDYAVFPILCDLSDYGIPQTRKRAFLTFIHRTEAALPSLRAANLTPYPRPTHGESRERITLGTALSKARLPSLDARSARSATDGTRPLHFVPVWDADRYAMVSAIPSNSGKSAWQNSRCPNCNKDVSDMNKARCPACRSVLLRPVVRHANGSVRLINGFRSSSYRRMSPTRPAATITTASGHIGSAFTIHPSQNRVLSPLECSLIQTIPRSFRWGDTLERFGVSVIRDMIGEAVPPRFTAKHGRILVKILRSTNLRMSLRVEDHRSTHAARLLNFDGD